LKNDKSFLKGPGNGGCHYLNVGGKKKNFLGFDLKSLPIDILDEKSDLMSVATEQTDPDAQQADSGPKKAV
jgi:hypothetical protein